MTSVTEIFRHPLKSHGREELQNVALRSGEAMPFDRLWAVAHEASRADGSEWVPCANFSRVSKAPALMAITSKLDENTETLTLSHPDRPDLTFVPDIGVEAFLQWVKPLVPQDRAQPARIIKLNNRGFTDSDFPSVTLCNHASHRAVQDRIGRPLSIHRWRGNIWVDTGALWEEFEWMGRELRIGECTLKIRERTDRCLATTANPETGARDADTLKALDHWGHQDFSVRAEVITGGAICVGDKLEVL